MTDKKKIILFYASIAVLAVLLIAGFIFLGQLRSMKAKASEAKREGVVKDVQMQNVRDSIGKYKYLDLQKDFTAVNQFGEEVTFQSLRGKVWVFAQFYGSCPECNSTNLAVLKELYEQYKGNPNFQIVTISVKPDKEAVILMKKLAEHYAGHEKNWWFISADAEKVNQFCQENMGYMAFEKNKNFGKVIEGDTSPQLEINHDMRISVFGPEMGQWAMVDISRAMKAKDTLRTKLDKKKLSGTIEWALTQIKN